VSSIRLCFSLFFFPSLQNYLEFIDSWNGTRKVSTQEHHLWRLERLAVGEQRGSDDDDEGKDSRT